MSFRLAFTLVRSREPRLDPPTSAGCSPAPIEGPRAARRLLQSNRPASTTDRTVRALPTPRKVALAWSSCGRWRRVEAAFPRVLVRGQPRFHGPGAAEACASARLLRRRSLAFRSFAPTRSTRTPICRSLVTSPAGGADDVRRSQAPLYEIADGRRGDRVARTRAASRVPPRRGARSAAPKVPSIEG